VDRLGDARELRARDLEQRVGGETTLRRQRVLPAQELDDAGRVRDELRQRAGHGELRLLVPRQEAWLAADAGKRLQREHRLVDARPQAVGDLEDGGRRQVGEADDLERRQVDDGRAVAADREPVVAGGLGDRRQPPRRAAGDEHDVHPQPLAAVERGERALGHRAVRPDDGAVQVARNHPHPAHARHPRRSSVPTGRRPRVVGTRMVPGHPRWVRSGTGSPELREVAT
jgi:hypothetical protein